MSCVLKMLAETGPVKEKGCGSLKKLRKDSSKDLKNASGPSVDPATFC